ncbi:gram-negative bacteria-binding protein 2-like [Drosophila obscura]|uniref:gram-negative bacteria-binding protein 2-like n=1 Tax=Drosophila obscura TaxID=7282 RepID=UPI001BB2A0C7|nr:gram-negative bacteria-binding protein 2-like [Drosophila obscura]
MIAGLLLLSLAGLVLGLGAFQIQPLLNETINDEWVWLSLPEDQRISSVFFYTEFSENKCPAFNYRVDPNSGHPWAIKEHLNDTLRVAVIVETNENETISGTFKILASDGGTRDSGRVVPVRKYSIGQRLPWDCETLNRTQTYCVPTSSQINDQPCACGGRMIFREEFENESWKNKWKHLQQSQLLIPDYEGVAFVQDRHNSYVKDNALHLHVTRSNYSTERPFYLPNCTKDNVMRNKLYCGHSEFNQNFKQFFPPYNSASIKSDSTFKYCRIDIVAKLPIGDWLFPVLSLKSKSGHSIRIAIVRGNEQLMDSSGNEIGGTMLFAGASKHEAEQHISVGKHFGEDFHTYTAIWKENIIIFKVDGRTYAEITDKDILEDLSESMCHIELAVTVGGEDNFPDSRVLSDQKPFLNKKLGGIPKLIHWKHPKLVIRSVRVYSITDNEQ